MMSAHPQILPPNAAAVAARRRRRPTFAPQTMSARGSIDGYIGCCGAKAGARARGGAFGAGATIAAPKLDVEGAAQHLEQQGMAHLAAGAGTAVAGALFRSAPLLVRLGLALGGTVVTILGVKKLAEGEATRQAGAQVGITLARCMASTIVGNIKTPV